MIYLPSARRLASGGTALCLVIAAAAGCHTESSAAKSSLPAPMVSVALPTRETVQTYKYFTGHTEAVDHVEIRAQVTGFLIKVNFTPGTVVKKDDLLFEIDPRPFKVELQKAEASLALSEAREKQMVADFQRTEDLFKKNGASQMELDKALANKLEASAAIRGAEAMVAAAKLNLGYARVTAPLTGQIGDKLVSEGNLIAGGQGATTLLTTIVSIDPMNAAFDVDENTLQQFEEAERQGLIKTASPGAFAVDVGLSTHPDYPLKGVINFANNQFDSKTGTVKVKASINNPEPPKGKRLLVPGMYVKVQVPFGEAVPSMLVPESAVLSDLGQKYIFVVGPENKAVRLDFTPGMVVNGRMVVSHVREPGQEKSHDLKPDERVIVSGVQRVRPGMVVDPVPAPAKRTP
jgi:RND family efflux transporter MFP subunit